MGMLLPKPKRKQTGLELKTYGLKLTLLPHVTQFGFSCLLVILFSFAALQQAIAQEAESVASTAIKALQIGDTIPDELWKMPLQVANHPEGKDTVTLNDYRDKLIILDFWASWCVPCIRSLGKLDSLQEQFSEDLAVIPITFEAAASSAKVFAAKDWSLPTAVTDTALKQYFPHRSVPHQVWIKDNVVRGIANEGDATAENIKRASQDDGFTLHTKRDILDFSPYEPISTYAERVGAPILYSSTITGFIDGLGSSVGKRKDDTALFINYTNVPAMMMYQSTLQRENNRIVLVSDSLEAFVHLPDNKTRLYAYQKVLPAGTPAEVVREAVLNDLNAYFGLQVEEKTLDRDCYVITDTVGKTGPGNAPRPEKVIGNGQLEYAFSSFSSLLNFSVAWTPDQLIYINESSFTGRVLTAPYELLQKDPDRLKAALIPYGLTVRKERRPVQMYVLSDCASK